MSGPAVRGYLRAVGIDPGSSGPSDAELLARFAATGDEAAFEVLVWRHSPLVFKVCEQVLRDRHAAEDAAQATFLVLARKAGTVGGRGSVVGWLYRVARRAAVRLARQRARLPVGADLARVPAPAAPELADSAALWEELARLPERYREPVLLCFFEGLTHAEAARRTGRPVGTVAGRLARAKELLGKRLSRRGAALTAIGLPVASGSFVGATAHAAAAFAAGRPVAALVPEPVLQLTHGVMQPMTTTLLKSAAAFAAALVAGAAVWAVVPAAQPPVPPTPDPAAVPVAAPVPKDAKKPADPADRVADAQQRLRSLNNLKQLMIGVHNYLDATGTLPRDIADKKGNPLLSWRVAILPYMDHEAVYKEFKLDEPWDSDHNKKLLPKLPKVLQVGFEGKGETKTHYQVFAGPGSAFEPRAKLSLVSITDGSSNTLGIVEAGPPVEWTKPADIAYDPQKAFPKLDGPFKNVVMVGMMDGAAYAFKPDLKGEAWHEFVTRAGGEVVDVQKARAESPAITKEEKELAARLQAENVALAQKLAAALAERQKLVVELMKRPAVGPDLEKLAEQHESLRQQLDALKAEVEALKKELEKP